MRAYWRAEQPLDSHEQWRGKLGKNSKQGTSAPTLAAVWGGPVELMGALRHQPGFEGLRLTQLVVEAQSSVDEFSGPRNHDLVARGELPSGECVVICVEAKAGESFGATVKQQTSAAAARAKSVADKDGKTSNAPERLGGCRISPTRRLDWRFAAANHSRSSPRRAEKGSDQMTGGAELVVGDLCDSRVSRTLKEVSCRRHRS